MKRFDIELIIAFFTGIFIIVYSNFAFGFIEMREFRGNMCYDGDTCYVIAKDLPEPLQKMSVRILGIDTPEIRGDCDAEKELARKGKLYANHLFRNAKEIEFKDLKWDKYGGRILSNVYLDGELYSEKLIALGFARAYDGGTKDGWCK